MTHMPRFDAIAAGTLPRVNPIFRDYVEGKPALQTFYRWDPRQSREGLLQALIDRRYPRDELAAILTDQNRAWGAPERLIEGIGRIRDGRAVAVVTGQQVGLFGGPLYTLYKALTAIAVARQVESQHRIPCLPIFWMDSEDTDFAEIDHISMPDHQDEVRVLRYDPDESFGTDLPATHTLTSRIGEAFDMLKQAAGAGRLEERPFALLQECYRPGASLVSAFARLLTSLLGERDLIVVDPSDPRLKTLARPLFLQEIRTAPASARLVQAAEEKLRGLGYPPQIRLRGEGPNLFSLRAGRRPLQKEREWNDRTELERIVAATPERFSPNVVLRPIMESFLFPTLAHVGGPHEIAYYAQLRGVFDHAGIPMPVLLPRASLTLVEGRIERLLKKHDLALPMLEQGAERIIEQVLRRKLPKAFVTRQQRVLQTVLKGFGTLKALVATLDPTLAPRVGRAEGMVKRQLTDVERLLLRSLKRRNQEIRIQVLRVLAHLHPGGEPQERVYGFMSYLCRHGLPLLDLVARAIDGPGWDHRLLYIAGSRQDQQTTSG
jgi:bacillithiol biosynthesis cysteine-adding enzyme BshC